MPVKKHDLSTGSDTIKGSKTSDLFLAPMIVGEPTLSEGDRLDGGDGQDTIRASLAGDTGAPILKNIERGIFTLAGSESTLDLAGANRMSNLGLIGTTSLQTVSMDIQARIRFARSESTIANTMMSSRSTVSIPRHRTR